jgi:hypothetical protein
MQYAYHEFLRSHLSEKFVDKKATQLNMLLLKVSRQKVITIIFATA